MARISEQSIERVRNAADVVDVISDYVDLKQKGRNFFGLCPFHSEKTPSFFVSPSKQIFKCFSTGKGGDAIEFLKEVLVSLLFPNIVLLSLCVFEDTF